MQTFFHPNSVAVVGASKNNLGYHTILNLLDGFKGPIYPVNPNYTEIEGLPCFPSLEAIPQSIDLVIVLVKASLVPSVLEACVSKGIGYVIIESAGFSETGKEGQALQERCVTIAKQSHLRLWGPNCMGLVDVNQQYFFSFMHPGIRKEGLIPGRISLIVQSGMMSAIFLAEVGRREIGIAKACSIGNRADVDECDVLEYLIRDPDTDVIALYLESIPRGRRFAHLAQQSAKPIILLKGGRSRAGAQAAVSHTYSLSGNSRLLDSVLEMAGVILVHDIYQMIDIAHVLTTIPSVNLPCQTAILTLSGGAGILACDALEQQGLPLTELSEQTQKKIGEVFPPWMPVANPIDLFPAVSIHGRDTTFDQALSGALEDPHVDVLLIHFVAGLDGYIPDFEALRKKADRSGKVIVFWLMGLQKGIHQFRQTAQKHGIFVHDNITRIAECLSAVSRTRLRSPIPKTDKDGLTLPLHTILKDIHFPSDEKIWDEYDSKQFLAHAKIPVIQEKTIYTLNEAWEAAQELGLPVVLKGLIPGKVHKTEQGLVQLGLFSRLMLETAFLDIQKKLAANGKIIIQRQVDPDYELIAGFLRDNQFGPCVMFGLGGIFSELAPDVAFAMAPLDKDAAMKLMNQIRTKHLFYGFRGLPPLNTEVMADILIQLGNLGIAYPQIEQIDINPLIVHKGNPLAVDANVILKAKPLA